jgi:hypothetical protein
VSSIRHDPTGDFEGLVSIVRLGFEPFSPLVQLNSRGLPQKRSNVCERDAGLS